MLLFPIRWFIDKRMHYIMNTQMAALCVFLSFELLSVRSHNKVFGR